MKKALLVSCFGWYQNRLKTVREVLAEEGFEVTVLLSDFLHEVKAPVKVRFEECTYLHVPPYKKNLSPQRIFSHLVFSGKVKGYIRKAKPDLIYALIPPNRAASYCASYKKKHPEMIYINDVIDMWPESMPLRGLSNSLPANVWRNWRTKSIQAADHVFTECGLYKDTLAKVTDGSKISPLWLYKERSPQEKEKICKVIAQRKPGDEKKVRFAFVGSINYLVDIAGICGVLSRFREEGYETSMQVIGGGERSEEFLSEVKKTGCEVAFHGKTFDENKKIEILAPCDYGFNMILDKLEVGLSIKSIDYLSMGLPLINSVRGDTARMVRQDRIGVNIDPDGKWMKDIPKVLSHDRIFDYYESHFSISSFKEQLKAPLEKLL